jgi:hypothetical protein
LEYWNSMTFQVFQDTYEPYIKFLFKVAQHSFL